MKKASQVVVIADECWRGRQSEGDEEDERVKRRIRDLTGAPLAFRQVVSLEAS